MKKKKNKKKDWDKMFEQLIFLIRGKPEFKKIFNDNMMKKYF